MTAFANSHLKVLKQCNAAIISAVRIYGNLLSQNVRRLFPFSVYRNIAQAFFCFSHALVSVSSLWCHHTLREFTRPVAAVVRGLPGCREAELMPPAGENKKFEMITMFCRQFCSVLDGRIYAPFTELSKASVYFIHASCGCGALSERSELCGAIANKRMYEIRERSVFSKRSVYSP